MRLLDATHPLQKNGTDSVRQLKSDESASFIHPAHATRAHVCAQVCGSADPETHRPEASDQRDFEARYSCLMRHVSFSECRTDCVKKLKDDGFASSMQLANMTCAYVCRNAKG